MEGIYALAWSPDGRWLAVAGHDRYIRIWDVNQRAIVKTLTVKHFPVRSLSWSADNSFFACGQGHWKELASDHIQVWRIRDGEPVWNAKEKLFGAYAICFSPNSKWLVSGHGTGVTILWQAQTGKPLIRSTVIEDVRNLINGIDFSPDSQEVVCSTCYENALYIYGIDGVVKNEQFFPPKSSWVDFEHPVRYSPDGQWLARGSQDGRIYLWPTDDLSNSQEINGHRFPIYSISWHPNGRILASGSRFGSIRFWDAATQKELGSIKYRPFHTIAFSPNGRILASGGDEMAPRIWNSDLSSNSFGKCLQVLG